MNKIKIAKNILKDIKKNNIDKLLAGKNSKFDEQYDLLKLSFIPTYVSKDLTFVILELCQLGGCITKEKEFNDYFKALEFCCNETIKGNEISLNGLCKECAKDYYE